MASSVAAQVLLFAYFFAALARVVLDEKRAGSFDPGVAEIFGSPIGLDEEGRTPPPELFAEDAATGRRTYLQRVVTDRGVPFDAGLALCRAQPRAPPAARLGFQVSKQAQLGPEKSILLSVVRVSAADAGLEPVAATAAAAGGGSGGADNEKAALSLSLLPSPTPTPLAHVPFSYAVFRPNTGRKPVDMTHEEIERVYDRCYNLDEARQRWTAVYERTLRGCIHGDSCKAGGPAGGCRCGSRAACHPILSGAICRVWGSLQKVLSRRAKGADKLLRVARARLPDGSRVVGVRFPEHLLEEARSEIMACASTSSAGGGGRTGIRRRTKAAVVRPAMLAEAQAVGDSRAVSEAGHAAAARFYEEEKAAAAATERQAEKRRQAARPPPPEPPAPVLAELLEAIVDFSGGVADDSDAGDDAVAVSPRRQHGGAATATTRKRGRASTAPMVQAAGGGGGGGGGGGETSRGPRGPSQRIVISSDSEEADGKNNGRKQKRRHRLSSSSGEGEEGDTESEEGSDWTPGGGRGRG